MKPADGKKFKPATEQLLSMAFVAGNTDTHIKKVMAADDKSCAVFIGNDEASKFCLLGLKMASDWHTHSLHDYLLVGEALEHVLGIKYIEEFSDNPKTKPKDIELACYAAAQWVEYGK